MAVDRRTVAPAPARTTIAVAVLAMLAVLVSLRPAPAGAQIVSPGRLSEAHAELEGVRSCTRCHRLRQQGVDRDRCLECHEPVATRLAGGRGYHARLEERDCGVCHKEHLGRAADVVRFDTAAFEHEDAGFELVEAHADVACRACHQATRVAAADVRAFEGHRGFLARTWLGLSTTCQGCHRLDSPHERQFEGRPCETCHGQAAWDEIPSFDHDAAAFRLTGAHRTVACDGCHRAEAGAGPAGAVRYTGLEHASCAACHDDPHGSAMAGACRDCHTTEGWGRVPRGALEGRFDHDRTGFPLTGGHGGLECASCHRPTRREGIRIRFAAGTEGHTYPRPVSRSCASCHLDPHGGELEAACDACHGAGGWLPTSFGLARHRRSAFPLDGAHAAVPCGECHAAGGSAFRFRLEAACRHCHADVDPHDGAFGAAPCGECHGTTSFRVAGFDHSRAPGAACGSCHRDDDPHGEQFAGRACDDCHGVETFRIAAFDHARSGFVLEGAHAGVACGACHAPERGADGRTVVHYRPVPSACRDCHGGTR